jgi:hypothetical protein
MNRQIEYWLGIESANGPVDTLLIDHVEAFLRTRVSFSFGQ